MLALATALDVLLPGGRGGLFAFYPFASRNFVSTTISSSVEIPRWEPRELIAGMTWLWIKEFADFPSSDWILKYNIRGVGTVDITALADPDGVSFDIVVDATTTTALAAGAYVWVSTVTNNASPTPTGEVYPVGQGDFQVLANYAAAGAGALQSNCEKMLAAVEGEIAARLGLAATNTTGGAASAATSPGSAHNAIEIAGRKLSKIPLAGKDSLYWLRAAYKNEIARLEYGGALPPVAVVFGDNRRGFGGWEGM